MACLTLLQTSSLQSAEAPRNPFALGPGDRVAFMGGADVAAAQFYGHLESLLTIAAKTNVVFRNFGWEGDTVFEQRREVGFPPLPVHLKKFNPTVIIAQYGRAEALEKSQDPEAFRQTCAKLLRECLGPDTRVWLVTPPPFENPGGLLPDLSRRNERLARNAEAIRKMAAAENWQLVDLFAELASSHKDSPRLTEDGMQFSPRGQDILARVFLRKLGLGQTAIRVGAANADGTWPDGPEERLRRTVVAKNQLWFDYWRPQNWAFLGGDRVSVPSSRDHINPQIRWFPKEMEKFPPLIEAREREILELVRQIP